MEKEKSGHLLKLILILLMLVGIGKGYSQLTEYRIDLGEGKGKGNSGWNKGIWSSKNGNSRNSGNGTGQENYRKKGGKKIATDTVLALSWHNSYCRLHPKARDCALKFTADWANTHFTLHGLWPQGQNYCSNFQPLQLSAGFLKLLRIYMPGVVEGLHIHEWRKHGSCFGTDAQTYFFTALKLTKEFNLRKERGINGMILKIFPTPIQRYFATHMGQYVTLAQVRWVFKKSFGDKNGRKFQLVCGQKGQFGIKYITEIRIKLKGDPTTTPLKELIEKAPEVVGVRQCKGGIIASPPM